MFSDDDLAAPKLSVNISPLSDHVGKKKKRREGIIFTVGWRLLNLEKELFPAQSSLLSPRTGPAISR